MVKDALLLLSEFLELGVASMEQGFNFDYGANKSISLQLGQLISGLKAQSYRYLRIKGSVPRSVT